MSQKQSEPEAANSICSFARKESMQVRLRSRNCLLLFPENIRSPETAAEVTALPGKQQRIEAAQIGAVAFGLSVFARPALSSSRTENIDARESEVSCDCNIGSARPMRARSLLPSCATGSCIRRLDYAQALH